MITVRSTADLSICPGCGGVSRRVHSRYTRRLADLPVAGRPVRLELIARRFRCEAVLCGRHIFTERFDPDVVAPSARRTSRLESPVRHLGLALGGRPAAAMTRRLMLPVSNDTLLRSVRRHGEAPLVPPDVIGIDDWAWKRNQRYGTIICDLERRKPIALLPDREPATAQAWLSDQPQISIVARDRGGGYALAAAKALPHAVQVADRWHLMENASHAFLAAVLALANSGQPIKAIVRTTGYSRSLVRKILRGQRSDVFRVRENSLKPYLPWLGAEWAKGHHNAAALWRRLKGQGFRGSLRVVSEWAKRRRRADRIGAESLQRIPAAWTMARLLKIGRDTLSKSETVLVAAIEAGVPLLIEAREIIAAFQSMLRRKAEKDFDPWIDRAKTSLIASFANGVIKDKAAVRAAIASSWSNGQTEGQITKLKLVKRQMYGRAKLDLLEARLLAQTDIDSTKFASEPKKDPLFGALT